MEESVIKALLDQARYYGLLSKRAARAARYASGAQKQILEEKAERFLQLSKDYFERAKHAEGR